VTIRAKSVLWQATNHPLRAKNCTNGTLHEAKSALSIDMVPKEGLELALLVCIAITPVPLLFLLRAVQQ